MDTFVKILATSIGLLPGFIFVWKMYDGVPIKMPRGLTLLLRYLSNSLVFYMFWGLVLWALLTFCPTSIRQIEKYLFAQSVPAGQEEAGKERRTNVALVLILPPMLLSAVVFGHAVGWVRRRFFSEKVLAKCPPFYAALMAATNQWNPNQRRAVIVTAQLKDGHFIRGQLVHFSGDVAVLEGSERDLHLADVKKWHKDKWVSVECDGLILNTRDISYFVFKAEPIN